jgi:hypothetical protein
LHNEELNDLFFSPDITSVIISRKMRWTGDVAHMGRRECVQGFGGTREAKTPLG